nr:immunoglobulin light chain junction region [Macaca mulatta]MOV85596.1 immunoglobulin light chain junction region [Macaca mulatta]
CMQGAQFPLTF